MPLSAETIAAVDAIAAAATDWFGMARKVEAAGLGEPTNALAAAFMYMPVPADNPARRERWGPLGPAIEFGNRVAPTPVADAPAGWVEVWLEASRQVRDPVARSRLADLVWLCRAGKAPHVAAQSAVDAYLETGNRWDLIDDATPRVTSNSAFRRALELALQLRDVARREATMKAIVAAARATLGRGATEPGILIPRLRMLAALRPDLRPSELRELLTAGLALYGAAPEFAEELLTLRAQTASEQSVSRQAHEAQVDAWESWADRTDGFVKLHALEKAIELAALHGLGDRRESLLVKRQGVRPEDLDLKRIESVVTVPARLVDDARAAVLAATTLVDTLRRFAMEGPPAGDHDANVAGVRGEAIASPFLAMMPKMLLHEEGTVVRNAVTDDERHEIALVAREAQNAQLWSHLVGAPVLRALRDRSPRPVEADFAEALTAPLVVRETARRVARAIAFHFDGAFDDAVSVGVPQVERLARDLARSLGLAVIEPATQKQAGGVRTLGKLISSLTGSLDESWRRHLRTLLVEPTGLNIRNRVAHGLVVETTEIESALLVHAAVWLCGVLKDRG